MKKQVINLSLILVVFIAQLLHPQTLKFLTFPTSQSQIAMGWTGSSILIDDPNGFLINPAQLGYTSQINNLNFLFYYDNHIWFDPLDFTSAGIAINLGYNFEKSIGFPLSVGFGYAHHYMDFGEFLRVSEMWPLGTFGAEDYYNAFSLGAGIDYYVLFSAGITYKSITSKLSDQPAGEEYDAGMASVDAMDFGFLLSIPIVQIIDNDFSFQIINDLPSKPYFNLSFGYSQLNNGEEANYYDFDQSVPIPRTARLGYGITMGLNFKLDKSTLEGIKFDFTVDADDILVDEESWWELDYQSGFGDINFGKNVIQIEGDDKVVSHAGLQLNLLETLILRAGHFNGREYGDQKANGFELRTRGLFKIIDEVTENSFWRFIQEHFDIRYCLTKYSFGNKNQAEVTGGQFVFIYNFF